MIINGINFPNQIVEAIKDRNLVVFAGAGASVGEPTSLPNFKEIAEKIAEGTKHTLGDSDPCEFFLGMLKAEGIRVNEEAAEILSDACAEPNKLHEAIIDLFQNPEDIKIVTTNYDQMFEKVLESRKLLSKVYNAPALPLGNDINGIIHIHGNVDNPKYMILTDEDFGNAYLIDGYASRFLVELFETYTVLFIGYSYNDVILRYLTRAMSKRNPEKRFILTDDEKKDWETLGINPIWFPERNFDCEIESLEKLGTNIRKGLLDWKKRLSEISDVPPKNPTIDTEVDFCLETIERTKILISSVHGKDWIKYLDKKKVFDGCFSEEGNVNEKDYLWAKWLCENFVGNEDRLLIQLVCNHDNIISNCFVEILVKKLISSKELKDEILSEYIVLIERKLSENWITRLLLENICQRNLPLLIFTLFRKLFVFRMTRQREWYYTNSFNYKHEFSLKYHEIKYVWDLIKETVCSNYPYNVMNFVREKIEDVHNQYVFLNQVSVDCEPLDTSRVVVEDINDYGLRTDALDILVQMYYDASDYLKKQNDNCLKNTILQHIDSESFWVKRIALKTIRTSNVFTAKESLDILLKHNLIECVFVMKQALSLAVNIFKFLNNNEIESLIDSIVAIGRKSDDRRKKYAVFHWCARLQQIDKSNVRINKIVDDYHKDYGFEFIDHPELKEEDLTIERILEISPISEDELKKLSIPDAIEYLKNYKSGRFYEPNRRGLLKVLSTCISNNYPWSKEISGSLIKQNVKEEDLWQSVFEGIDNANYMLSETLELLQFLSTHVSEFGYDGSLSNSLFKIIERDDVKNSFQEYEIQLFSISENIWYNRKHEQQNFGNLLNSTINTTVGVVIQSWIHMVSYLNEVGIPEKYKKYFEQALRLDSWERSIAICILVGYFNYFYCKDKEWCNNQLAKFLNTKDQKDFSSAWEGFVYFSRRIIRDTADIITPIFLSALNHLNWLENNTKQGFIRLFLIILIYNVDKPTLKFIPEFYSHASEEDAKTFIDAIQCQLIHMEVPEKKKWWDDWLRLFLENRKKNKPILTSDSENQAILELLPELEFVYNEAAQIICQGEMPKIVNSLFWYSLKQKHLARNYPNVTATVVTKVLNASSITFYDVTIIKEIVNEIDGLNDSEQKRLQDALLKNNIDVS